MNARLNQETFAPEVFVGIDVSEKWLHTAFVDEEGRDLRPATRLSNDPDGYAELRTACEALQERGPVLVGCESTGVAHKPLLRAIDQDFAIVEINPKVTRRFAELELRRSRTDRSDARSIANYLRAFRPKARRLPEAQRAGLARAVRRRRGAVQDRSAARCRLRRHLCELLPGYPRVFRGLPRWVADAVARAPPPEQLLELERTDLDQQVAPDRFEGLQELARQAPRDAWDRLSQVTVRQVALDVVRLYTLVDELDQAIEEWLDEHASDHVLWTVPGCGPMTVATLLAEARDPHRFPDVDHFIGYCGLYPGSKQSGEGKWEGRMVRKGNKTLRTQLLLASTAARTFNPIIRRFYQRLLERGKTKTVAGGAAARKFATQLFAIWRSGEPFDPDREG